MDKEKLISVLNDLIETCKDSQEGFRKAAEIVKSAELKHFFEEESRNRAGMAITLQAQVVRFGGEPEKDGTVSGALHRTWMDFKDTVNLGDHSILESVESEEDKVIEAFDKALKEPLPPEVLNLIRQYHVNISNSHDRVKMLRDSGKYITKTV
jgi:uncharacterized protein (TIGR02284 family)